MELTRETPSHNRLISEKKENDLPFYGLLIYTFIFYSQIAGRFPFLSPLRLEFVVGSILVIYSLARIFSKQINFNENIFNYAAFSFIFVAFISVIFAYVKMRAFNAFIELIKFFAIYLMIITTINNEKKLRIFVNVYLFMTVFIFFEPFLLSLQGKGFIYNNHMWRLAGTTNYFGHPNHLGGITAANLPFLYYFMKYSKSTIWKIIYFILIGVSFRVIMLTQSRTAFIGVLAFGFFVWIFSRKKILSLPLIVIALIILWSLSPQETKDRFISLGMTEKVISGQADNEEAGSMYSRWVLIQRGFEAFKENPFIGLGPGCFISFNGHRYGYFFPPHNTYLQALSEMGIIGFSVFLWIIVIIFKNLNSAKKLLLETKEEDRNLLALITTISVFLSVRLVVIMFGQELYDNYWWISGGLSVVILRIAASKHTMPGKNDNQMDFSLFPQNDSSLDHKLEIIQKPS